MAGENEEAMRIILMLGQAALPPARELLIMTMRALSRGAGKVADKAGNVAKRGANSAVSHVNGLGRYGMVSGRSLRRDPRDTIKLVDVGGEGALSRDDLSALAEICRQHRVGFSVFEDPATGYFAIEYKMRDEQALSACIQTAVQRKMLTNADVESAMRGPVASEATVANAAAKTLPAAPEKIEYLGEEWKLDETDSFYKRPFKGWDGIAYTAAVSTAGDFRIIDQDGRTAHIGKQLCEGSAKGSLRDAREEALTRCRAQAETLKDVEAFACSVKLQDRKGRTAQMGSKELIRAVNLRDAQDRKANRRKVGTHNRPAEHTRNVSKGIKR